MEQLLRVQSFTVSADGFGAGEPQTLESPFGHVDPRELMAWRFGTAVFSGPGGSRGLEDYLARDYEQNIGAEIMGRNKFSPVRGPWPDEQWKGWWGDEPPFHTPVFVMTHHPRPSFSLSDTTFHFVAGEPADVLATAKEAAEGRDVRLGGGASTICQFIEADLVDTLHIAVSPIKLGSGTRLWQSPMDLDDRYHREEVASPSGVVHHLLWRR
ncbi:MAG: dihydrofolate reductase family protein [Pseudonocardiales bacterium]|nr:dihydrofolate reductase family protein [Pseudonocardiales bacterium]